MATRACPHCGTVQTGTDRTAFSQDCPHCGLDLVQWYSMALHNSEINGKCLSLEEIERQVFDEYIEKSGIVIEKETNFKRITESPEKLAETLYQFASYNFKHCPHCSNNMSEERILEWLQEECDFPDSII